MAKAKKAGAPKTFSLARRPNDTKTRTNTAWARVTGYQPPQAFYETFGGNALTPRELGVIMRAWAREVAGKELSAGTEAQWFSTAKTTWQGGNLEAAYGEGGEE